MPESPEKSPCQAPCQQLCIPPRLPSAFLQQCRWSCALVWQRCPCLLGPANSSVTLGIEGGYGFVLYFLPGFANLGDSVTSTRKQRFCVLGTAL